MTAPVAPFDRARWSIYAILVASYLLVFFHRMAPAVVSADLMRAFGTTGAALGSLAATYFYLYTVMQIPAGVLADTVGARLAVANGVRVYDAADYRTGFGPMLAGAALAVLASLFFHETRCRNLAAGD